MTTVSSTPTPPPIEAISKVTPIQVFFTPSMQNVFFFSFSFTYWR